MPPYPSGMNAAALEGTPPRRTKTVFPVNSKKRIFLEYSVL